MPADTTATGTAGESSTPALVECPECAQPVEPARARLGCGSAPVVHVLPPHAHPTIPGACEGSGLDAEGLATWSTSREPVNLDEPLDMGAVLDAADAADPGPEAWAGVVIPDEDEAGRALAAVHPPRPTPTLDEVRSGRSRLTARDVRAASGLLGREVREPRPDRVEHRAEDAGSRATLRAVLLCPLVAPADATDRERYVALSRAHGDLATALDEPTGAEHDPADALAAVAALGLAWLDTLDLGVPPGADALLRVIAGERASQRRKHPTATLDLPGLDDPGRFVVLAEEVGEVANALTYDEGDQGNLARELVQVVALALAWLDGIDQREGLA